MYVVCKDGRLLTMCVLEGFIVFSLSLQLSKYKRISYVVLNSSLRMLSISKSVVNILYFSNSIEYLIMNNFLPYLSIPI